MFDPMADNTVLEMAHRHVALAERFVAKQKELIATLERDGHDARKATELLDILKDSLAQHVEHRDRLLESKSWN